MHLAVPTVRRQNPSISGLAGLPGERVSKSSVCSIRTIRKQLPFGEGVTRSLPALLWSYFVPHIRISDSADVMVCHGERRRVTRLQRQEHRGLPGRLPSSVHPCFWYSPGRGCLRGCFVAVGGAVQCSAAGWRLPSPAIFGSKSHRLVGMGPVRLCFAQTESEWDSCHWSVRIRAWNSNLVQLLVCCVTLCGREVRLHIPSLVKPSRMLV